MSEQTPRKRYAWRWAVLTALLLIVGSFVLSIASMNQFEAAAFADMPEESLLLTVQGRAIHVYPAGLDHPDDLAVVFVPCFACSSELWQAVQLEISQQVRTYAYDPPGSAWSAARPDPTPQNVARYLEGALQQLAVERVILVGFSAGMLPVHVYHETRDEASPPVAAMVSIEGSPLADFEADLFPSQSPLGLNEITAYLLVETGIARLIAPNLFDLSMPETITNVDYYERVHPLTLTRKSIYAWHNQFTPEFNASIREAVQLEPPTDIVVYVFDPDDAKADAALAEGNPEIYADYQTYVADSTAYYQAWVESALPGSRYIPVEDSSHYVMYDQPQVVIDAVLELVDMIRSQDE